MRRSREHRNPLERLIGRPPDGDLSGRDRSRAIRSQPLEPFGVVWDKRNSSIGQSCRDLLHGRVELVPNHEPCRQQHGIERRGRIFQLIVHRLQQVIYHGFLAKAECMALCAGEAPRV